jgi:hypothetical protein
VIRAWTGKRQHDPPKNHELGGFVHAGSIFQIGGEAQHELAQQKDAEGRDDMWGQQARIGVQQPTPLAPEGRCRPARASGPRSETWG